MIMEKKGLTNYDEVEPIGPTLSLRTVYLC